MTLTQDEREAAIEKMAHHFKASTFLHVTDTVALECGAAALDAVLPLIERAVLLKAAEVAEGESQEFDFQQALAECRDSEYGFHNGRIAASTAIRALADEVRT